MWFRSLTGAAAGLRLASALGERLRCDHRARPDLVARRDRGDHEIDRRCLTLDRDAEILLVGRVVSPRDMGLMLASTRIGRNLERMADQCVTIGKLVLAGTDDGSASDNVRGLLHDMGQRGEGIRSGRSSSSSSTSSSTS
jgi:hypothetical protein